MTTRSQLPDEMGHICEPANKITVGVSIVQLLAGDYDKTSTVSGTLTNQAQ